MKKGKALVWLLAVVWLLSFQAVLAAERGSLSISEKEIIERLTRLEEGQKSIQNQINGLQNQISGLRNVILGGFGVVFAGIFSLIGFVIWDRRSAISPVINRTREMEERQLLILKAMKEYALKEPKMSEVLKSLGLLRSVLQFYLTLNSSLSNTPPTFLEYFSPGRDSCMANCNSRFSR